MRLAPALLTLALATTSAAEIHLEPFLQNTALPDGGRRMQVLFLWHRTTDAAGETVSYNLLNWIRTPSLTAALPLYYRFGEHTWLVPFWFDGPEATWVPPALSASWRREDGGRSLWITPLFHRGTDADGNTTDAHLLTWYRDGGRSGVLPLWMSGEDWWAAPALLSGRWRIPQGGSSTWVTPFFHRSTDAAGGTVSMHALNWWHDRERDLVLPIAWRTPDSTAVLPFWIQGGGAWASPALLSAGWDRAEGGSTSWITPFWHRTTRADGSVESQHAGPWWRSGAHSGVFPVAWHTPTLDAIAPLWFAGPDWWLAPPALSASWSDAGGRTTWITPLFHRGPEGMHLGPWWRHGAASGVFPLYWKTHAGMALLPAWFQGRDWWAAPPALSASWSDAGGRTTWITPLYHQSVAADGRQTSRHLLSWVEAGEASGLLPFWFRGPETTAIPPLLSWSTRRADGSSSLWVTPFFHRDADATGATTSLHAVNYVQAGDRAALLPIWFRSGEQSALLPIWFRGRDSLTVPLALSAWWRRPEGGDSTWITPLWHRERDAAGATTSLHAGPWLQGRDWAALAPLWAGGDGWWLAPAALSGSWRDAAGGSSTWVTPLAHWRRDRDGQLTGMHVLNYVQGEDTRGLLPLWIGGDGYGAMPPLLSAWWRRDDGGSALWVTPLWHQGRDAAGAVTDWHLGPWLHGRDSDAVLPVWWRSGGDWAVPPLLAASWSNADGRTTWVTPLYHRSEDAAGRLRHQHLLNWISTPDWQAAPPLWWDWRTADGGRSALLAPLWYRHRDADGATRTVLPPLLAAWRTGGRLDTTLEGQLWPFLVQEATDGSEVNVLWRLYHQRTQGGWTERNLGPLWWSGSRPGQPADWQILGGLVGQESDPRTRTRQTYALWLLPLGSSTY